ncbi:hypothetical protein H0H81_000854 [Sphagnurus paluster]|uniref:DUF6697 domain-containing protein n=1 Tax=Sphagnurus paluster TaxID=117069 RepID=A0A9P7GN88_9AGAR|nr:hypothetical protein H0H81_000854 [Sphagnurus paluster]
MFLNITYNPYAPQRPGYPGLFYRTHATELPKIHRVFIRVKDRVWLYIGQYELVRSEPLTVQEWAVTSEQTKKKWASQISKQLWGQEVRTRIALRRSLRREPTAPELARAMGENIEDDEDVSGDSDKDSNGFVSGEQDIGSEITAEDVRHAFDKGDEVSRLSRPNQTVLDGTLKN